jgi:hypothetical protein
MFTRNNPEIDFTALAERVEAELHAIAPTAPATTINHLAFASAERAIRQLLQDIEPLAAPRTVLPPRLARLAWLGRFLLKIENRLFFRQRLALSHVSAALRLQIQINRLLVAHLSAVTRADRP